MDNFFNIFGWWIAVIEIPILSSLFWMIWRINRDLSEHKLHVARHYARTGDMRELEGRLTSHLLRIEAKLDVTALKAESLSHPKGR